MRDQAVALAVISVVVPEHEGGGAQFRREPKDIIAMKGKVDYEFLPCQDDR